MFLSKKIFRSIRFEFFELVKVISFIIFTMASNERAFRTILLNSIDYLLKPSPKPC